MTVRRWQPTERVAIVAPSESEIDALGQRIAAAAGPVDTATFAPFARPLEVTWAVDGAPLTDSNRRLLEYWRACRTDGRVDSKRIDPLDFAPELGTVLLLDVIDGGLDARFRVYGTKVATHAGRDWTGARVSEMCRTVKSDLEAMYRGCYRAVALRPEPLFSLHQSPPWLSAGMWSRVILPLRAADGAVERYLVSNCPVQERILTREQEEERRSRVFHGRSAVDATSD